jgi:type IV pilus assembly protein PilQ
MIAYAWTSPSPRIRWARNVSTISRGGVGLYPVSTSEVKTQVLVNNGETVVLGGGSTGRNKGTDRALFSDIPILGNLFKRNSVQDDKAELLIFVTPKIIKDNLKLD